ncbi:LOW QUALITY PROTEIN: hypothetical protein PHMEG_00016683 [Phytophthora megakarya]|uniref:Uncharacterized protein n=1 Tax=Phytophthora megakarya TaxID=4795 RepID=A0A225W0T3_9STRA|nr:LOW QUALITY PROTEIN: hypothetical protein PHMEG_00016683 [Phytophthora megakarya]
MGRRLRSPNELLRSTRLAEVTDFTVHRQKLVKAMQSSHECADRERRREQERQARYYHRRKAKKKRVFKVGDHVQTTAVPQSHEVGPMKILDEVGYENCLVKREDGEIKEQFIAHVSFLVTYKYPTELLRKVADDIVVQLADEDQVDARVSIAPARTAAGTTISGTTAARRGRTNRRPTPVDKKTQRIDRTRDWWSCDADGDATSQEITCWSTTSRPYTTTRMDVTITRADDGCPSLNKTPSSMPARSWKTLVVAVMWR